MKRQRSDVWYFAYGSNLDPGRKQERTGRIREAKKAVLLGFRLTFRSPDGYADIEETGNLKDKICGVVYRITENWLKVMDRFEGVKTGVYRRKHVKVLVDGREREAIAYEMVEKGLFQKPSDDYLNLVVDGLRYHGYGEDVAEEVKRAAKGRMAG